VIQRSLRGGRGFLAHVTTYEGKINPKSSDLLPKPMEYRSTDDIEASEQSILVTLHLKLIADIGLTCGISELSIGLCLYNDHSCSTMWHVGMSQVENSGHFDCGFHSHKIITYGNPSCPDKVLYLCDNLWTTRSRKIACDKYYGYSQIIIFEIYDLDN